MHVRPEAFEKLDLETCTFLDFIAPLTEVLSRKFELPPVLHFLEEVVEQLLRMLLLVLDCKRCLEGKSVFDAESLLCVEVRLVGNLLREADHLRVSLVSREVLLNTV